METTMRCEGCQRLMAKERDEELDQTSDLRIQGWHCLGCGGAVEEIRIQSDNKRGQVRRIRYAVRPQTNAAPFTRAVKRMSPSRDYRPMRPTGS